MLEDTSFAHGALGSRRRSSCPQSGFGAWLAVSPRRPGGLVQTQHVERSRFSRSGFWVAVWAGLSRAALLGPAWPTHLGLTRACTCVRVDSCRSAGLPPPRGPRKRSRRAHASVQVVGRPPCITLPVVSDCPGSRRWAVPPPPEWQSLWVRIATVGCRARRRCLHFAHCHERTNHRSPLHKCSRGRQGAPRRCRPVCLPWALPGGPAARPAARAVP